MTNYWGRKVIKRMQNANLATNMQRLLADTPDWSCFHYARQYREECGNYNRLTGGEYIHSICSGLEEKIRNCQRILAKEIENCKPYAEDETMEVENRQPWLEDITDDGLAFEPLASAVTLCDLRIGGKSIFQETLENLWESGITRVTLVTEKNKVAKYKKYQKQYNFGRRQGHIDVTILGLNVDKILPGNVLRELTVVLDGIDQFLLLFWDTLITVPLSDALELHKSRRSASQKYAMSLICFEDDSERKLSKPSDDCIFLLNDKSEILAYSPGEDKLRVDVDLVQNLKRGDVMNVRYDLCETGIYICNKQVAEHFTNWYEHTELADYINDCLTREFKTDEVYLTIIKPDIMFPNYPPAIRIMTPKDYHTVFMEYIQRFQQDENPTNKHSIAYDPIYGPMVNDRAIFCNKSAVVPPLGGNQDMLKAVSNSIIGKGIKIGEQSKIDRCVIYDDVNIGSNCLIQDSIIMNGVTIEDGIVIPPGSIICSDVTVTQQIAQKLKLPFRLSKMQTKYIDLTVDDLNQHTIEDGDVHVWPITAFGDIESTYIGKSFFDVVKIKIPSLSSTDSGSEYEGAEYELEDIDYADGTSSDSADGSEFERLGDGINDDRDVMDEEIAAELKTLVIECLQTPAQLQNKILEIKSLKISHNLQKENMVKVAFRDALKWIIEVAHDEDELQEIMEKAQLKEFLESFEHQIVEQNYYTGILEACTEMCKDIEYFSFLCEALYHADIMEFDELHDWLMEDTMKIEELYRMLQRLGVRYTEYKHQPMMAVKQSLEDPIFQGKYEIIVKNLWLRDEVKKYYLLVALHDTKVDFKFLSKQVHVKQLRMGPEECMEEIVGMKRGHLNPFAVVNDKKNEVKVLLDERIKEKQEIMAHALHNTTSICISTEDLVRFLKENNHEPTFVATQGEDSEKEVAKTEQTDGPAAEQPAPACVDKEGHILGITVKKDVNFPEWYIQAIVRGGMVEYYDISGCYIYLPSSYFIWEVFQQWFNEGIKKEGVENCYFPMFVSKQKLETEKNHIEGFSPEVAWVTKYGDSDFVEPIAIRPTSETIMYPEYAKWIRSHRDLPLKLNQWCSVVRWEFKQPTPFLRTREFLWQEGHTAHRSEEEAMETVLTILKLYQRFYEEYLAVPVIPGEKSIEERFAGGKNTTTIEAYIPGSGRGIQAATSHLLGTNFAKMFGILFEDESGTKQLVHQTSWGFTTRSIGVAVMIHGDDKGLVMPPKVAKLQVVVVPIIAKKDMQNVIMDAANDVYSRLKKAGIRIHLDDRTGYTPGFKFNHWELRGVPIRIEIGARDVQSQSCRVCYRFNGHKADFKLDNLEHSISEALDEIQKKMYEKAKKQMDESVARVMDFEGVMPALNDQKLVLVPWCEDPETEAQIKAETQRLSQENSDGKTGGMKCLCLPFEQPEMPHGTKCFWTGRPATRWALFGRSY
ncbi:Proline--tRNA ligase [Babesia sp. Xinjiang]|uniref:Proline--tRNA ligase n=1 Tax=Babesia sp. Xinjiang TaxID=462227 RepID=UPI000A253EAC|nr:Proline--tRNA ligase [Babesia sp. Xinjiang]ORM40612.1 Proline--tRNA ligase [Babesia sp. Xinjiang]